MRRETANITRRAVAAKKFHPRHSRRDRLQTRPRGIGLGLPRGLEDKRGDQGLQIK